jgi:hypothetical protein
LNTIATPFGGVREESGVAWMRMMGAESVDYHRETIIERGDDFPGAALDYYGSRGETPLAWGGSGAASLGLVGAVDNPSYDALYGPGGATDPTTGERLVSAKRPGMELVIAAHKSVAELGVLGRVPPSSIDAMVTPSMPGAPWFLATSTHALHKTSLRATLS